MATTLRDFIAQRETEIRDQQKALKAELRELQIAKAALEQGDSVAASSGTAMTIKEMAREVLSGMPNGLNSSGILDGIKKAFGRDIERTSLSPQLSRLKDDGELYLDGDVWFTKAHYAARQESVWGEAGRVLVEQSERMPEVPVPSAMPMPQHTPWDEDDGHPF